MWRRSRFLARKCLWVVASARRLVLPFVTGCLPFAYNSFVAFKSGFVAIVGRPNAGKSTLVNTLVGRKVAIVSPKPQTTRNRIQGILNRDDAQIVLIDTPGIHKPENVLSRQMMDELQHALEGIDILSLIVDAAADSAPATDSPSSGCAAFTALFFCCSTKWTE